MNIIGLIAEYNPFHNGHQYQINKIKEKYPDSILIAVISSSYTQRGDISVLKMQQSMVFWFDRGMHWNGWQTQRS